MGVSVVFVLGVDSLRVDVPHPPRASSPSRPLGPVELGGRSKAAPRRGVASISWSAVPPAVRRLDSHQSRRLLGTHWARQRWSVTVDGRGASCSAWSARDGGTVLVHVHPPGPRHRSAEWHRALAGIACLLALLVVAVVACRTKRPGMVYRLDGETRGWVVIVFNRPEAPPLPMQDGRHIVDVPRSGVAITGTQSPVGYARDTFLVRQPDGREAPLPLDSIRANHVGATTLGDGKPMEHEVFFVGSRGELEVAEKEDAVLSRVYAMLH
jgi:hypothetical protein